MLQNADHSSTLNVQQIAAHLDAPVGSITRELKLGDQGLPGRLRGTKQRGPGMRGSGGQWRVDRTTYLDWLGVPAEDRHWLDEFGLPTLVPAEKAPVFAGATTRQIAAVLSRLPHITFGRRQYLTHHQLRRLGVLLADSNDRHA